MCPALRDRVIAFDARRLPARPGLDRRRVRRGQGPPDPRRAAGRHRAHARHRRRHGGGRRLARREAARPRRPDPPDERAPAGRARPRPRDDRGQGRSRHARRAHPRARPWRLRPRRGWRPRLGRAGSGSLVVGGRRRGPGAAGRRPCRRRRDRDRRPRADPRAGRRARRGDPAGDHVPRRPGDRGGRRSWRPPPASAAGRSAASRRRSGSSVTSPPSPRPRAGTSRPGSGWACA